MITSDPQVERNFQDLDSDHLMLGCLQVFLNKSEAIAETLHA